MGALIAFEDVSAQQPDGFAPARADGGGAATNARLALRSVRLEPEVERSYEFGSILGESAAPQDALRTLTRLA